MIAMIMISVISNQDIMNYAEILTFIIDTISFEFHHQNSWRAISKRRFGVWHACGGRLPSSPRRWKSRD